MGPIHGLVASMNCRQHSGLPAGDPCAVTICEKPYYLLLFKIRNLEEGKQQTCIELHKQSGVLILRLLKSIGLDYTFNFYTFIVENMFQANQDMG